MSSVQNSVRVEFFTTYPIGFVGGVYNTPRTRTELGTPIFTINNFITRDTRILQNMRITPPTDREPFFATMPTNLLVTSETGVETHYIIDGYEVSENTINFFLTYNALYPLDFNVQGLAKRLHVNGGNFRDMLPARIFEPWLERISATTSQRLVQTPQQLLPVVELDAVVRPGGGVIPLAVDTNFVLNLINRSENSVLTNTSIFLYNETTAMAIARANALGFNPVVSKYSIPAVTITTTPMTVSITDGTHDFSATIQRISTVNAGANTLTLPTEATSYTGTNQVLRGYSRFETFITGTTPLPTFSYDYQGNNALAVLTADYAPTGSPICMPAGLARGQEFLWERLIHNVFGEPWVRLSAVARGQTGEAFARLNDEIRRREINEQYSMTARGNEIDYRQNELNNDRYWQGVTRNAAKAAMSGSVGGILGGAASIIGNELLQSQQRQINRDSLSLANEANRMRRDQSIDALEQSAALRQQGATRIAPHTGPNTAGRYMSSFEGNIVKWEPTTDFFNFFDRHINAYGQMVRVQLNNLNRIRNIHSVYGFESVNVQVTSASPWRAIIIEEMLRTGVRIWEVTPSIAGVYNNP